MNKADLIIADNITRNQILLERFTAGEKNRVIEILLKMQTELKMKLQNGLTDYGKARVKKLLAQCTETIKEYYSGVQQELDLTGLAKHEMTATQKAIASVGLEISMPTSSVLKAMVRDTLLQGAPLKDWWAKQSEDTIFQFNAAVRQGVAQSETLQQIITRVVGSVKKGIPSILDVSRRNASTLVHDSIMQIANNAALAVYRENSDVVKGVHWLATFDSHTCVRCAALSGSEWDLNGKPINGTTQQFNIPPLHPNDRCKLTSVLKTFREIGVDVDEMKPGTRASDLGQIPADTSFSAFLKRHSVEYQDDLLGNGRAKLWRAKKITMNQMLDFSGRPLTLAELQAAI